MVDIALLIRVVQVDVLALSGTIVKWAERMMNKPFWGSTVIGYTQPECTASISKDRLSVYLQEFVYCQSRWSQIHSPVKLDCSNPM